MVGRCSFPFGKVQLARCELFFSGSVASATCCELSSWLRWAVWENDLIWDWGISVSVPQCPNLFSLSMCVWKKIPIGPGLVVLNFFNRLQLRLESRLSTCISLLVQFLLFGSHISPNQWQVRDPPIEKNDSRLKVSEWFCLQRKLLLYRMLYTNYGQSVLGWQNSSTLKLSPSFSGQDYSFRVMVLPWNTKRMEFEKTKVFQVAQSLQQWYLQ